MNLQLVKFKDVNLNDPFFDSLKSDYKEFTDWFTKKSEESTYIHLDETGRINGFLYQKVEIENLSYLNPPHKYKKRIKIGTLKIDAHGTRLGERFIKKAIDFAVAEKVEEIYVTIFPKHTGLITLFSKYGFMHRANKSSKNGIELVLFKEMKPSNNDINFNYPLINLNSDKYILSIYPQWHSRLLPDSILTNEDENAILRDVSHTNSIHKIYLTKMKGTDTLKYGDVLVIYRTTDNVGPAHYRSVVTSLCIVEEVRNIASFRSINDFLDYTSSYSIFDQEELKELYMKQQYPVIIKFNYNYAFPRRITRGEMIEQLGINSNYWGFLSFQMNILMQYFKGGTWMKVLLSIKPEYVTKIMEGNKTYEFRKAIFKEENIDKIVVYATKPVGKVVGEFEIDTILNSTPDSIWEITKNQSGISEEFFSDYFKNRKNAFAIKIKNPVKYLKPIELTKILPNGIAPQSFCYLR